MPASNLPLVSIGVILLWFGWFRFNGGSVLNAGPGMVSPVPGISAAAALTSWVHGGKPDLSLVLNGIPDRHYGRCGTRRPDWMRF